MGWLAALYAGHLSMLALPAAREPAIRRPAARAHAPGWIPPIAHAATHQNGGSDEVATATPAAGAIPKADAGGTLDVGWLPTDVANGIPSLDGTRRAVAAGLVVDSLQVVGTQKAAIADPVGGGVIDVQARTAVMAILARLRAHGLIAT